MSGSLVTLVVVKYETMEDTKQLIIVAIDHSEQAAHAVQYYMDKMHRKGNKLMLVHCIELPEMSIHNAREIHMSPGVLAAMWKEEESKSRQLEEKMKVMLTNKGISAKLRSCAGKPGEMICRIAEEENATLIVTGGRGMGTLRRTILGSVSDYLLKHAYCPVIVCRDPEAIERQRNASGEGKRSRHSSGRMRQPSGEKTRHPSGESFSFASQLRQRFASGSRSSKSQAHSLDEAESREMMKFENTIILYPKNADTEPEA